MKNEYSVKLENVFEGPLDLLLFLIKKEEIDIYNIPIAKILDQYVEYIQWMEMLDLEVAGEFLVMAATLMYIKSKTLLPVAPNEEAEEIIDPRLELINQLLEYQKFKEAANYLEQKEQDQKNIFERLVNKSQLPIDEKEDLFEVDLFDLIKAFSQVLKTFESRTVIREITYEEVKVEEKMADIIEIFKSRREIGFKEMFASAKTKIHVIATFLAVLELIRVREICIFQNKETEEFVVVRNT